MQEKNNIFYNILPNGVKIVHRKTDSAVAYVGIMIGTGTREESADVNGMAHYIEHCVFKGTETRTARQIISQIEGIGGEVNAYTTKEETTFYAATPVEHLRHTFRLISDMVLHPTFPKKETDKELGVILDEIESYNDSPSELIYDDFEALVFAGSSLSQPILGTKKTLRRISKSPEIAKGWMAEHYQPEKMVVFVQGNISAQSVCKMVKSEFSQPALNPRMRSNSSPIDPQQVHKEAHPAEVTHAVSYKKHTHQTHVMLGGRAYALGHERQLVMYLLNNILGGGSLNSRLNLSLREKRGLVYTVESTYTPLSDTGYWCIYFACEPEHKDECLRLVKEELRLLREHPLTVTQLRRALTQLRGQMAIAAENQENNALSMAKQMLYYGEAPTWQETFAEIEKITPEQLQNVASELFDDDTIFMLTYE